MLQSMLRAVLRACLFGNRVAQHLQHAQHELFVLLCCACCTPIWKFVAAESSIATWARNMVSNTGLKAPIADRHLEGTRAPADAARPAFNAAHGARVFRPRCAVHLLHVHRLLLHKESVCCNRGRAVRHYRAVWWGEGRPLLRRLLLREKKRGVGPRATELLVAELVHLKREIRVDG